MSERVGWIGLVNLSSVPVTSASPTRATKPSCVSSPNVRKTEVGASETLRIHSRLAQVHALVTFEGEGVIAYEVLALKSGMNPLQFTVRHGHFPNFYLGVAAIDGQQLRTTQKHFVVERKLNLKVSWKEEQSRSRLQL